MRQTFDSRLVRGPAALSTIVVAGSPDEDARLILAAGLTNVGFHTRLAGTGDELLREARADDVSLVIAEVGLACAEGPCAIEALKRAPDIRDIAVVVYCVPGRVISKARALSSGADRFIGDPAHLGGVLEAIASMPTGFETINGAASAARGHDMPARTNTPQTGSDESPQAMRERQSAEQVAEWEAAFRVATSQRGTRSPSGVDRANGGAIVSRAHRAEKRSGGPPEAPRPQPRGADTW